MKLAIAFAVLAAGCHASPCGATEGKVTRVIDGDTIVLDDGTQLRYLLIDAPEHSSNDCFAANATQANTDLVLGKTVELGYDVDCTDRFGRSLAYVYVDGHEVNTLMIRRGYACVLHIPPNGDSRIDELKALELDAMRNHRGLWGACNPRPPACSDA